MSMSLSPMNSALSALAGLNDVTSQMNTAQQRISTGKAVNGYADNAAAFFAATTLTNQQSVLKQTASLLNSNLNSITGAQGSLKTIQDALNKINTALTGLSDQTATTATRNALALTIQNQAAALNSAIADDGNNALALGRGSLIAGGVGNGGLVVNLGNGQKMNIAGANLTVQATGPGSLGFSQADIANIVALANYGTTNDGVTTTTATATVTPLGLTTYTNGTFSTAVVYADANGQTGNGSTTYTSANAAAGIALRQVTTFTATGSTTASVVAVDATTATGPSASATTSTGTYSLKNAYADANGSSINSATGLAYTAADAANNPAVTIKAVASASGLPGAYAINLKAQAAQLAGQISTTTVGNVVTTVANAYADNNGNTINALTKAAYTAADVSVTPGVKLRQVTTVTTQGLPTYVASLQSAIQQGLATTNAFGRLLGGASDAINTVLNNNTNLQSTLSSQISSLVDADVAAEQVKLQALQVQQQLSVSALSSINQSRQALLSLFR